MMRFWLVEGLVVACSPADDVVVIVALSDCCAVLDVGR